MELKRTYNLTPTCPPSPARMSVSSYEALSPAHAIMIAVCLGLVRSSVVLLRPKPPLVVLLACTQIHPLLQVAHQIFRRYETYKIAIHTALLFGPPTLIIAFVSVSRWSLLHAVLVLYPTYLATLATSVVIYRLSPLHPLARYPSPIGCTISKLYLATICVPGYQHKYIKVLHDRYGDVVRIGMLSIPYSTLSCANVSTGPNELSIRDASLVDPLLGSSGVPKGPRT